MFLPLYQLPAFEEVSTMYISATSQTVHVDDCDYYYSKHTHIHTHTQGSWPCLACIVQSFHNTQNTTSMAILTLYKISGFQEQYILKQYPS